jgi:hypothetical protein
MNKKTVFSLLLLLSSTFIIAQENLGGHPSDVNWKQINSKNVRVIFPEGLEQNASRIADVINHINTNNRHSIGEKSKKLELVLQTNQVISNGYVALSPYRSEFYATGLQNNHLLGSTDWLDLLSIHEYRHALQYTNANRGFTNFLHIFQGQNGWALGANLSIPNWYFEGDATLSETLLSKSGRGRSPAFFKELRANLLNGKEYSYMTSRNRSLKRLLPNQYPLGYTICNYTRNKYGTDVWKYILSDAGRYTYFPYPFSRAMQRHTGQQTHQMYKLAYAQLKKDWEDELKLIKLTPIDAVTKKNGKTVTNYRYSQVLNDNSIIALKNSYSEIGHLIQIKNGVEEKLTTYGITQETFLSENNGILAWTELQQDPRRANRNYTRIVTYDIENSAKKYVTTKSKYFSPQVSSTGAKIITVKADENIKNKLVVLNAINGNVINEIPNPKNDFLSFPKWTNDDTGIVYIAKRNSQLALMKYDFKDQTTTTLTEWTAHTIGATDVTDDYVYFSASFSGIDNIYRVSLNGDKKINQLTSVKIGAYEPTVSNDETTLIMGEFTEMGYVLSKVDLKESELKNNVISYQEPIDMDRYNVHTNSKEQNILESIEQGNYEVKDYNGFFNGLKLHSWNFGNTDGNPTFDLHFANILSNFQARVGVLNNLNEETSNLVGEITFGKWFTEIGLQGEYMNREIEYFSSDTVAIKSFDESNYGLSLSIPLNWLKENYLYSFSPSVKYSKRMTSNYNDNQIHDTKLNFNTLSSSVSLSVLRKTALQNIHPRYGFSFDYHHQSSISDIEAKRIKTSSLFYLPGLDNNHGIKIDIDWQKELNSNEYQFSDMFFYSRGYENAPNDETFRVGFNYALPLAYPDWGYAGLTYFKRIRANLFYDMGQTKLDGISSKLNSYGAELIFDNTFMNVLPISIGMRQSFLLNTDVLNPNRKNHFEIFIASEF